MASRFRKFRYRAARSWLSTPIMWFRHLGLDSRDVLLASYPRSGQHWTRFQLFEMLTAKSADFDTLDSTIPKLGEHGKAPSILPSGGRLIQTHQPWRKQYRRAIYLVRDVRDVVLSDYAWDESLNLIECLDIHNFDEYLVPWLRGKTQTPGAGSWQDHTHSWLDSPLAKNGDLLLIKFEDLRRNTEDGISKMADFLGVCIDREGIRSVIENSSVDKMRAKEDASKKYDAQLLGRQPGEEHRFVRKGSVGGWRERLTEAQLRIIDEFAGSALARLGYPTGDALFSRQTVPSAAGVPAYLKTGSPGLQEN